jgi:hypothetical protein
MSPIKMSSGATRVRSTAARAKPPLAGSKLPGLLLIICLLLPWSACRRKADVKAEATALERALSEVPAPPSSPQGSGPATAPSPAADLITYGNLALAAVRSNDYAGSVIALEAMQQVPGLSAQQREAVQRTKSAITTDLINRADRGDPRALADLKAIEKTHSQ